MFFVDKPAHFAVIVHFSEYRNPDILICMIREMFIYWFVRPIPNIP